MATDIVMPNLGFDAQENQLMEWLKQPGDQVKKGEPLAVFEGDKAAVELESIAAGILLEQLYEVGDVVSVGALIARIGEVGERPFTDTTPSNDKQTPQASPVARRIAKEQNVNLQKVSGSGRGGRVMRQDVEKVLGGSDPDLVSPLALPKVRKAAREAGVELTHVPASGRGGITTMADLKNYLHSQPSERTVDKPSPAEPVVPELEPSGDAQEVKVSRMRQRIGQLLSQSKQDAPHFYVTGEFDLEPALQRLGQLATKPQPRINDLLQYITVQTLLEIPQLNATYENGRLFHHPSVALAVAVAIEDGLITPVISAAERYSLQGLAAESRALIKRTRNNRLQTADLQRGTFTISNLGVIKQVDHFTAVLNPPQVAILAVGTVKKRPLVINDGLHLRHTVHLTLSGDHRVVDGMHLGRFLAIFQEKLNYFSKG